MTSKSTKDTEPRRIEYMPLESLQADPRNPKDHSVGTINDSISRFGTIDPISIDGRTGYIISGHGRTKALRAMHSRGETAPDGVKVDENGTWLVPVYAGWSSRSDTEASAALIALNQTTVMGGWVDESLLTLLDELEDVDGGLTGVGFDYDDIDSLRAALADAEDLSDQGEDPEAPEDTEEHPHGDEPVGDRLALVDSAWGEPRHTVKHGQVYRVGKHTLVVAKLLNEHHLWAGHLREGVLFCPYPEPYLLLSSKADQETLLLVQPVHYLAGHLLDKFADVHGEDAITLLDDGGAK